MNSYFRDPFSSAFSDNMDPWLEFDSPFGWPPRHHRMIRRFPRVVGHRVEGAAQQQQQEHHHHHHQRQQQQEEGQEAPLLVDTKAHQVVANLDVSHFKPEEVSVRVVDDMVEIEGKHEEKMDEHGFVSRHFVRKFKLPDNVTAEQVASALSSDGMLAIQVPKQEKEEEQKQKVRRVPIQRVAMKSKPIDSDLSK